MPPDAVSFQWNENSTEFSSGSVFANFDWPGSFRNPLQIPRPRRSSADRRARLTCANKAAISCAISHAMALNSVSKKKDAAVEFIKYTVMAGSPIAQLSSNSPIFRAGCPLPKQVVAAAQGQLRRSGSLQLEETIATGKEWPKLPGFSRVCTLMFAAIERAISNQMSPGKLAQPGGERGPAGDDAGRSLQLAWRSRRG